jgi:hypothetical protein
MEEFDSGPGTGSVFVMILFILAIYAFFGFCMGKVFEKAGRPLWTGFVPIYNYLIWIEIVGRPQWWIILYLIPFVNVIIQIVLSIDLAKSFGKDVLYGVAIAFLSPIMLPIMAFSNDVQYTGPSAAANPTAIG